jgi:hypothetical protein
MPFPPVIPLEVSWNGKEKASSDPYFLNQIYHQNLKSRLRSWMESMCIVQATVCSFSERGRNLDACN